MKTIIICATFLLCISYSYAQTVIDPKYKNPGKGEGTNNKFTSITTFSKDKLIATVGKEKASKMMETYERELYSFNKLGNEVWIYEDEYFNGAKKVLPIGDYTLEGGKYSKGIGKFWNDKISSVLIPLSLKVDFYIDDNFQGLLAQTSGYGTVNMETGEKGFRGDYYSFQSGGKYSKGGIYFVGSGLNSKSENANDNISSFRIFKNPNY